MSKVIRSAGRRPCLRTVAVVPAAGYGRRLGLKTKKPFVLLKGRPLVARTLKALNDCAAIDEIIVASEASSLNRIRSIVRRYGLKKVRKVVAGGETRFISVKNCLACVGDDCDIVLVHDGARPFIDDRTIRESIKIAVKSGACIVGSRVTDTVKLVDKSLTVKDTLDRDLLVRAQTPQVFRYGLIKRAYAVKGRSGITDDAGLIEAMGVPVKVFIGPGMNMKITTREDMDMAEALL